MKPFRPRVVRTGVIDACTFNDLTPEQQKAALLRMEEEVRRLAKANGCPTCELDADLAALDDELAATLSGIETVADRLRDAR